MNSQSTIAIISTLISSIALVGVVVSLLLQARQIRVSQLQASRSAQAEMLKVAIEDPEVASAALGRSGVDVFAREIFLNLQMKTLELHYLLKLYPAANVSLQTSALFRSGSARIWWNKTRHVFQDDANTRRERQFFVIVDTAYGQALLPSSTSKYGD